MWYSTSASGCKESRSLASPTALYFVTLGVVLFALYTRDVEAVVLRLCWPCRGVFGALVAGMVAGLWGVTGWIGFSYYLASHAVVSPACL